MAYDLKVYVEGEWEMIGHHSPLYPKDSEDDANRFLAVVRTLTNCKLLHNSMILILYICLFCFVFPLSPPQSEVVEHYIALGAPTEKIVLGKYIPL
jgi:hypothetical protein